MQKGSCQCGAIEFEIQGELTDVVADHSEQSRKASSHYWAACDVQKDDLKVRGEENISWYHQSEKVRRAFCLICGSPLFLDNVQEETISVSAGALEKPTDAKLAKHINVAEKGEYYEIADGLPQSE